MSYGIQLFNAAGFDATSTSKPLFIIDMIRPSSSGGNSYSLIASEGLEVTAIRDETDYGKSITGYSVSGSTVSWTVEDTGRYNKGPNVLLIMKYRRG